MYFNFLIYEHFFTQYPYYVIPIWQQSHMVWTLISISDYMRTGNDHLCDAWELFSRFSSTHVLIYLSTLSREVFDEKSVLTFTYDASSFLFEIFPAGLVRGPRNPKFLSEKASFDIFFQYRLYYTACLAVIWVFWSPW